jgi:hypothetical protein
MFQLQPATEILVEDIPIVVEELPRFFKGDVSSFQTRFHPDNHTMARIELLSAVLKAYDEGKVAKSYALAVQEYIDDDFRSISHGKLHKAFISNQRTFNACLMSSLLMSLQMSPLSRPFMFQHLQDLMSKQAVRTGDLVDAVPFCKTIDFKYEQLITWVQNPDTESSFPAYHLFRTMLESEGVIPNRDNLLDTYKLSLGLWNQSNVTDLNNFLDEMLHSHDSRINSAFRYFETFVRSVDDQTLNKEYLDLTVVDSFDNIVNIETLARFHISMVRLISNIQLKKHSMIDSSTELSNVDNEYANTFYVTDNQQGLIVVTLLSDDSENHINLKGFSTRSHYQFKCMVACYKLNVFDQIDEYTTLDAIVNRYSVFDGASIKHVVIVSSMEDDHHKQYEHTLTYVVSDHMKHLQLGKESKRKMVGSYQVGYPVNYLKSLAAILCENNGTSMVTGTSPIGKQLDTQNWRLRYLRVGYGLTVYVEAGHLPIAILSLASRDGYYGLHNFVSVLCTVSIWGFFGSSKLYGVLTRVWNSLNLNGMATMLQLDKVTNTISKWMKSSYERKLKKKRYTRGDTRFQDMHFYPQGSKLTSYAEMMDYARHAPLVAITSCHHAQNQLSEYMRNAQIPQTAKTQLIAELSLSIAMNVITYSPHEDVTGYHTRIIRSLKRGLAVNITRQSEIYSTKQATMMIHSEHPRVQQIGQAYRSLVKKEPVRELSFGEEWKAVPRMIGNSSGSNEHGNVPDFSFNVDASKQLAISLPDGFLSAVPDRAFPSVGMEFAQTTENIDSLYATHQIIHEQVRIHIHQLLEADNSIFEFPENPDFLLVTDPVPKPTVLAKLVTKQLTDDGIPADTFFVTYDGKDKRVSVNRTTTHHPLVLKTPTVLAFMAVETIQGSLVYAEVTSHNKIVLIDPSNPTDIIDLTNQIFKQMNKLWSKKTVSDPFVACETQEDQLNMVDTIVRVINRKLSTYGRVYGVRCTVPVFVHVPDDVRSYDDFVVKVTNNMAFPAQLDLDKVDIPRRIELIRETLTNILLESNHTIIENVTDGAR